MMKLAQLVLWLLRVILQESLKVIMLESSLVVSHVTI